MNVPCTSFRSPAFAYARRTEINPSEPVGDEARISEIRTACREMESLFIYQLLKKMRATVPDSFLSGGGIGGEIHGTLMDLQLSSDISNKGGIGLASVLFDQLTRSMNTISSADGGETENR